MSGKVCTVIFLLMIILTTGIIDTIIISKYGIDSSISSVLLDIGQKYPIVVLLLGILLGHLLWPQYINDSN